MKLGKICSHLLIFTMVLSMFLSSAGVASAASMDGEGTIDSPYLVKTPKDLYDIKDDTAAYYKLANDIDFENIQRQPIDKFSGVLDGNGYTIKNMYIVGTSKVGLFGVLTNATIKNITFDTPNVLGSEKNTGVIFGESTNSTFIQCQVKNATVKGTQHVGGLGGYEYNTITIENCSVTGGKVEGTSYTGGFVGHVGPSKIKQSYATITVEGKGDFTGGIIGFSNGITIEESFYNGKIVGAGSTGGIIGYANDPFGSTSYTNINNTYAHGTMTITSGNANGIIGERGGGGVGYLSLNNCYSSMVIPASNKAGICHHSTTENTKNSYFDGTVSGLDTPLYQVRTTEQMYQKNNYVDWDFEDIWTIENGKDYPKLKFASSGSSTNPGGETGGETEQPGNPETPTVVKFKMVLELNDQLQLSLNNNLAVNEDAEWSSSDNDILTVDNNGVAKALKTGSVVVTVKYEDEDYIDQINILIVKDATYLRLAVDLKVGEKALATIDDLTDTVPVKWSVMNPEVATVSKRGNIIARGKGLTMVTATDSEGNTYGHVYVRVR